MKVICAGLPKTGTKSMASALRMLGYSVYDFDEHWAFHKEEFIQAFSGREMPDFSQMYSDIDAITDVPASLFYKEIFKCFPDAKVILAQRDNPEMWTRSMLETRDLFNSLLTTTMWAPLALMFTPSGRQVAKLWTMIQKRLTLDVGDPTRLNEFYVKYNEDVCSTIPRDKLLVMNIREGWQPLCKFLDVDTPPAVAFPRENVGGSYVACFFTERRVGKRMFRELMAMGGLAVGLLSLAVAYFLRY